MYKVNVSKQDTNTHYGACLYIHPGCVSGLLGCANGINEMPDSPATRADSQATSICTSPLWVFSLDRGKLDHCPLLARYGLVISQTHLKWLLIALLVSPLALSFGLGLYRYSTIDAVRAQLQIFRLYHQAHPFVTLVLFGIADMAVAAFSIPIATVMTLSAGALFDFLPALIVVSIASNIGATIPFLAARYLMRNRLRSLWAGKLAALHRGLKDEGPFYLFAIRLTPLFPFWMVNLLMGLTPIETRMYFWVTLLGTMPGRILYILAGRELGNITSPSDILSPSLFLALTALGFFPLAARRGLSWWRGRRS
jgi:uncharacterized membrane protein YdjX (TVP38/TMEM64 family)